jgi:hypothetical protein
VTGLESEVIDYSEGYLSLKAMIADFWQAVLDEDIPKAKEICTEISVTARLLRQQLSVQHEQE